MRPGDSGARDARLPPGAEPPGMVEGPDRPGQEARGRREDVVGVGPGVTGQFLVDVGDGFGRVRGTQGRADGEARRGEVGV